MKEIRVGPGLQLLLTLATLGGLGALVAAQVPEIKRYLNMRAM